MRRASCPGLRVLPVTPAGLGVDLVEPVAQTRTAVERQIPAVRGLSRGGVSRRGLDLIAVVLCQLHPVLDAAHLALDAVQLFLHPS